MRIKAHATPDLHLSTSLLGVLSFSYLLVWVYRHSFNMASTSDHKIASMAMGFTLGFGLLTVWEAWKQTRRNRNPLRSTYIYMLWGEIAANLAIAIIGWVFLDGIIGPT